MTGSTLRVAVVGCGNIAGQYARTLQPYPEIVLCGATDIDPQRATGAQAAHVVEILNAIDGSLTRGGPVDITSSFPPPEPLDWAK